MEQETEEKKPMEKLCEQVDKKIEELLQNGVQQSNIDYFYKLVDIKKDVKEMEEKNMRYGYGYDGNYGEYGTYGRRGVPGTGRGRRYRGEDALDEMKYHYGAYQDSYNMGNYNAKEDSSEKMIEAFKKFIFATSEELEPQDKMKLKRAMQDLMQELDR